MAEPGAGPAEGASGAGPAEGASGAGAGAGGGRPAWRDRTLFAGRRGLRVIYLIVVLGLGLALAYRLRTVLNPLLLALLLAYVIDPAIRAMEVRFKLPRTAAILLVFLAVGGAAVGVGVYLYGKTTTGVDRLVAKASGGWQLVPEEAEARDGEAAAQTRPVFGPEYVRDIGPGRAYLDLNHDERWQEGFEPLLVPGEHGQMTLEDRARDQGWRRVPGTFDRMRDTLLERYQSLDRKTVEGVVERVKENTAALYEGAIAVWHVLVGEVFGGIMTALSYLVLVPVYTFFLLHGFDKILARMRELLPGAYRRRILDIAGKIDQACAAFFRGRFLIAVGKGVLTWLGLWAIGIDFALFTGLIAGALSIIPFVGPVVGMVLATVFSYAPVGWGVKIVSALVVFLVVEALEGIANPLVLGRGVGLHPVTILIALFAFGDLLGLFGLLLAVPLGAIVKILGQEFVLPELRALAAEPAEPAGGGSEPPAPPGPPVPPGAAVAAPAAVVAPAPGPAPAPAPEAPVAKARV